MKTVLLAVATIAAMLGLAQAAHADWRRHDDDWRWRRPHHYHPYPREVIMIYPPPPPVIYAPPQVVYVEPPPVQATPMSDPYNDSLGRYCREYQSNVVIGGVPRSSYGTACLQPDGVWRIVR